MSATSSVIRGLLRGNRRKPLTSKEGNKNYYKGSGSGNMGRHTTQGGFIVESWKRRTFAVPEGLATSELKPYVAPSVDRYPQRRTLRVKDYFDPDLAPEGIDPEVLERCRQTVARMDLYKAKRSPESHSE